MQFPEYNISSKSAGYVTCILDDAKVYTNHAKKKIIDLDDVKLASQMVLDKSFTNPPPRDVGSIFHHILVSPPNPFRTFVDNTTKVLLELARGRNIAPLPPIKSHCGLRLPPDRYCLIATNYKLKAAVQPKKMTKSALGEGRSSVKTTLKGGAGGGGNGAAAKRQNIGMGAKQQNVSIPKPVFKFSSKSSSTPTTTTTSANAPSSNKSKADIVKMEMDEDSSGASVKRKRDDDDFQIVG